MAKRVNAKGRNSFVQFVRLERPFLNEPAWRALSNKAQMLYVWLRMEWKGPHNNNNGRIRLSVRQAMPLIGKGLNATAAAFRELQAKGYIVVTEPACLGVEGMARSPAYELTELAMPRSESVEGRKLYRQWRKGHEFPVIVHGTNNPEGWNGKSKTPSSRPRRTRLENRYVQEIPVAKSETCHLQNSDVRRDSGRGNVIKMETSLFTRPRGEAGPPDLSVTAGLDLCPMLAGRAR